MTTETERDSRILNVLLDLIVGVAEEEPAAARRVLSLSTRMDEYATAGVAPTREVLKDLFESVLTEE